MAESRKTPARNAPGTKTCSTSPHLCEMPKHPWLAGRPLLYRHWPLSPSMTMLWYVITTFNG